MARRPSALEAFTLIELLVVMGILVLLMSLMGPAVNALKGSKDFTSAVYGISGSIDQAHAYAMANHTYVYFGIAEVDVLADPNSKPQLTGTGKVGRVVIAAVATRDGTRWYDANSASASWASSYNNGQNLTALGKVQVYDNVHLAASFGVPPDTGRMARPSTLSDDRLGDPACKSLTPFSWPLGSPLNRSAAQYFFEKVILIDPQGHLRVQVKEGLGQWGYGMSQWLEIGMQPTHANVVPPVPTNPNAGNYAAIMLNGLTGATRVFRP